MRAAMLGRLERMPRASDILPFVRLSYAQPSTYSWFDEEGERKVVTQAEGGEQGDPLMPLLFSIGIQGALEQVARLLKPGEHLCAFLDDIYMVCEPERVRPLYNILGAALHREAGISLHTGKTRVWNRGGIVPAHVEEMGLDVWNCDGIKVLGTPLGTAHFVASLVEERIAEERRLWEAIPSVPDLQCAWQILVQSANPRSNHTIRTLPPSQSAEYARQHDEGMWATVQALLTEVPGSEHELRSAEQVPTLPMRMGGLGMRSASRCAPAAYWASWSDALHMIHQRTPAVAESVVTALGQEEQFGGCVGELQEAAERLDHEGFWWRPSWEALRRGERPTSDERWRTWRVDTRLAVLGIIHFRHLLSESPAVKPYCRSSGALEVALWTQRLAFAPTAPEFTIAPHLFRVLVLERLHLPLPITEAVCEGCGAPVDIRGHHRAACMRTGRVKKRAVPTERVLARVF